MEEHVYSTMAETGRHHWWFVARRAILSTIIGRLHLPKAARIVELGCGPGGELGMLSQFGAVAGMEPSKLARELAHSLNVAPVVAGELPGHLPFPDSSVDLAVCLDVIEHVGDDQAGLKSIHRILRPEGWLLVTVPAFAFLFDHHDVSHHHFRRYGRRQLVEVLASAGFEPFSVVYYNCFLFPLIVLMRLIDRVLGRQRDYDRLPSPALNQILKTIFRAERHVIGRLPMPFGVSLVALARPTLATR
jgi:SAM-dependent methyltransferase